MKRFLFYLSILIILHSQSIKLFPKNDNNSDFYLEKSSEYAKAKNYTEALICHKKAIQLSPTEGFYKARLGQFYLFDLKDNDNAISYYLEAIKDGFSGIWMYFQLGDAYYNKNQNDEAKKYYDTALETAYKKIKNSKNAEDVLNYKNEALSCHARLIRHYNDKDDFENSLKLINDALKLNINPSRSFFISQSCRTYYWQGYISFGNKNLDKAEYYFNQIDKLRIHDDEIKEKYSNVPIILNIIRNRKILGEIKPDYSHKIMLFYINETDIDMVDKNGKKIIIKSKINERQKKYTLISLDALRSFVESLSAGRLTIEYQINDMKYSMKKIKLDPEAEENDDGAKLRYPDLSYLSENYGKYFKNYSREFDTYFFVWSSSDYNIANGGQADYPFTPEVGSAARGIIQIPAERLLWNGPFLLMHEFFHVAENLTGISCRHGFNEEKRKSFPEWKGNDELDYYIWQFKNHISEKMIELEKISEKKGFANFSFINR